MRNMQYMTSKHRNGIAAVACLEQRPDTPENLIAVVEDTLSDMENIVSNRCIKDPETLAEDRITAYALALVRLRECASAAGFERLVKACDALAVTVSRLIEDKGSACREKCEALTRFVVHAKAMIQMSLERTKYCALPAAETATPPERRRTERRLRASI